MKSLLLVLAFAALAFGQTSPPTSNPAGSTCFFVEIQTLEQECLAELNGIVGGLSSDLDATQFCAGQCAADIRRVYTTCPDAGPNVVDLICGGGGGIVPELQDANCVLSAVQESTECFTLLSGDPTAFCTSSCATTLSDKFTACSFTAEQNPIQVLCGGSIDFTGQNPICLSSRLSTLSNCALELVTTPTLFCAGECAQSVSNAYEECGFTGDANVVGLVCSGQQQGPVQDPICLNNRIQNLGGCINTFLSNISSFCDSACSDALDSAYIDCGYGAIISSACSNASFTGDEYCLVNRLQALESCTPDLFNNPTEFCESSCVGLVSDAYVDCGLPISESPSYSLCVASNITGGPDPICLAERQANLQTCINTFFTAPTTFCSSPCYPQLRDSYTDCGYTGADNPFATCIPTTSEDPICVTRRLLQLGDCFNSILTNLTEFCESSCRNQVSLAYEECGFVNQSNPANICFLAGPGSNTSVDLCLASELQTVGGCLTGFTNNPYAFCTTECATTTRDIYDYCGYTANYGYNPVDLTCAPSTGAVGPDTFCIVYALQNQTGCLSLLLTNSTGFCASDCAYRVSSAYEGCGFTGYNNPVNLTCSQPGQDPICLSTNVQSPAVTACFGQILTDRGGFCESNCRSTVSNAYTQCGYYGFYDPTETVCNGTMVDDAVTCITESTVYQDCISELALDPSNFCTSTCASSLTSLYQTCNLPANTNPGYSFCQGLVPAPAPGEPSPTCLFEGLGNLQNCVAEISTNPTNFCGTSCRFDLSAAYEECGYPPISNPVTLLCDATPTDTGDLTCLNATLPELQDCIVQLATQPTDFCNSQCSLDLNDAYTGCGFTDTANPVNLACGAGFPGQDPGCIAGKLLTQNDCTSKLDDQDFCGSECDTELRTAYSECGFTGTTNPVAILCSGAPSGTPNTICLGVQLQLHQECISTLISSPSSVCSTDSGCANALQGAYSTCGYTGEQNPFTSACGQTGGNGAPPLQALPVVAFTLLLLVVAALLF